MRKKHPNKEIEAAVCYAEERGWRVIEKSGHAWGSLVCPQNSVDCRCGLFCQMSVWSTPRNPEGHARQLRQKVDGCIYQNQGDLNQGDLDE